MHRKSRDDYLLINSLVGYGYSPIEPWMIDAVKYYEGDEYYNSVPSILHQEDKKSKPSATKKATTKTIYGITGLKAKICSIMSKPPKNK